MKKTAFVTGATSGFGEAIARRLSKEGYKIVALARREDRLKKLASELGDTHIIVADIRDKKAVFDAVDSLPDKFKDIEVLVNNAGLALGQEKTIDAKVEDFETMIDTNVKGLIYSTKAVLPLLYKQTSNQGFARLNLVRLDLREIRQRLIASMSIQISSRLRISRLFW